MVYKTHGVCSTEIRFDIEDNRLVKVTYPATHRELPDL